MHDLLRAARALHRATPEQIIAFDRALDFVKKMEGGLGQLAGDPGGLTNWGISSRAYPRLNIHALTWPQARTLYFADYWLRASCDYYPHPLAVAVLDYAVHSGWPQAVRTLQRELRVKPDAQVGPKTKARLRAVLRRRSSQDLATAVVVRRSAFLAGRFKRGVFPLAWLRNYMRRLVLIEREIHRA
jgi:lysozyme family protein